MRWEEKPLGEVCEIQNGFAFKSKDYGEAGARVIRIGNVQKGVIRDKSPRYLTLDQIDKYSKFQLREGDILISLTGDVGRVGKFPENLLPALLNQRVGRFQKFDLSTIHVDFLFHVLNSDSFEKQVINSSEGAAQKNSSTKKIKSILIPIPPLEEQQHIVELLDEAFEAIDKAKANIERNLANARELFQSRLNEIFANPSEDWEEKPLGEVCEIGDGNHSSKYPKASEFVSEGIPFLRATNLRDGTIDLSDVRNISSEKHRDLKKGHLEVGDILFSNRGELGNIAIIPKNIVPANLNSQLAWIRCKDELNENFLFHCLSRDEVKQQISFLETGAALKQLPIGKLNKLSIYVCSASEQKRVIKELHCLKAHSAKLVLNFRSELDNLEELRQSILEQAFEGKLTDSFVS